MNIKNLNPFKLLSALIGCLNRLVSFLKKPEDPWVEYWQSLPPVPKDKRFGTCKKCGELLGVSPDRFPRALCSCGSFEVPNYITKQRAMDILFANERNNHD